MLMKMPRLSPAAGQILGTLLAMICAVHGGLGGPVNSASKLTVQFYDSANHAVPDVTVGRLLDTSDFRVPPGQPVVARWRVALSGFETVNSDHTGTALLNSDSLFGKTQQKDKIVLYALSKDHRLAGIFPVTPDNLNQPVRITLSPAGRVQATITSRELLELHRNLDRSFLRVSSGRDEVLYMMSGRGQFEFWLPPGTYEYQASGRGSGGASVGAERGRLDIPEGRAALTLGPIDLHAGKLAGLLDKAAPAFEGITAWRNGPAVSLVELRGKVVILDFWNYACSICCAEMPELFNMQKEYADKGLVIIGIHGLLPTSAEEFDRRTARLIAGPWKNRMPPFRLALDPRGEGGTSAAYGITAVPAIVLIDRAGKLVAEFGNPVTPEFHSAVQKLLGIEPQPRLKRP